MEQKFTNDMDFNFKLVIIDNLLYNKQNLRPDFQKQYQDILNSVVYQTEKSKIISNNVDDVCTELYNYVKTLKLSNEDLDKINELKIDTIAKIYSDLQPNWDGYSNKFNIYNINGIEKLKNLKKVDVVLAMIDHDISNNVEDILKTLNCEVLINDGFDIYNIKNREDNKQLESINNFSSLLQDYIAQIKSDKALSTAMWNYAEFRVSEPTDKLIFNNNESNYNQKLFGKSPAGNDYVLLDNEKVGYVDHEGSCTIIANNVKDFFAFLLVAPDCLYSLLPSLDSFDDFVKTINEAKEYQQKHNDYIEYEQIINKFLTKNNIETDIEIIYKNVLEAVITEPPLIMTIREEKKSYFPTMPITIDEYTVENEWLNDESIQKIKEIYSNLVNNNHKKIDVMSDNFKYKLGIIFNDELKQQLISDNFKDVANKDLDFGLKQEFYSNDKLYLSFNADVFDENSNMILNNIIILEGNQENSFLDIKLGDYNSSAKAILKDNNYKEAKSEIENIKKYVNIEKNIVLELWLEDFKIYKIIVESSNNEDVKNIELMPEFETDSWAKTNLNKIIFSDEKYGDFRLTGLNGEMLFSEKSVMFGKYQINDLEFKYYKPENHQIYINTLNYIFDNKENIIQKIFEKIQETFDEWGVVDQNSNKISLEYLEKYLNITHIEISGNYGIIWGDVELYEKECSGIYSFDAHLNMTTQEISLDMDFARELDETENIVELNKKYLNRSNLLEIVEKYDNYDIDTLKYILFEILKIINESDKIEYYGYNNFGKKEELFTVIKEKLEEGNIDKENINRIQNIFSNILEYIKCSSELSINEYEEYKKNVKNPKSFDEINAEMNNYFNNDLMCYHEVWLIQGIIEDLISEIDLEKDEKLQLLIHTYKEETKKECYKVTLIEGNPNILDDKIGGIPYLPLGENYPIDKKGNPMALLLQVDLKNIDLEGWPKIGILEIFVNSDTATTLPLEYKIKYFKNPSETYQQDIMLVLSDFIDKPHKFDVKKDVSYMPISDYRSDKTLIPIVNKIYGTNYFLDKNVRIIHFENTFNEETFEKKVKNPKIIIGGYVDFIQNDPRSELSTDSECLFNIDSEYDSKTFEIGDAGIIFATISKENIIECNFDKAIVDWSSL